MLDWAGLNGPLPFVRSSQASEPVASKCFPIVCHQGPQCGSWHGSGITPSCGTELSVTVGSSRPAASWRTVQGGGVSPARERLASGVLTGPRCPLFHTFVPAWPGALPSAFRSRHLAWTESHGVHRAQPRRISQPPLPPGGCASLRPRMVCISWRLRIQAVLSVRPSGRLRCLAETPYSDCVSSYIARHQVVSGSLVRANTVPAVREAWRLQRIHWKTLRVPARGLGVNAGGALEAVGNTRLEQRLLA